MARVNRSKYKFLDQRTGRLARAVELTEDGEIPGLKVARREADKKHPLSLPYPIPPDRVQLKQPYTEKQVGPTNVLVGYGGTSTLGQRQTIPTISYGAGGVSLTYTEA